MGRGRNLFDKPKPVGGKPDWGGKKDDFVKPTRGAGEIQDCLESFEKMSTAKGKRSPKEGEDFLLGGDISTG